MVSAASPLAGDDGLGTPFGAPRPAAGPAPNPPPIALVGPFPQRPPLRSAAQAVAPHRSCPDASGPTAVTLSKAKGLTLDQILRPAQNDAQALPASR